MGMGHVGAFTYGRASHNASILRTSLGWIVAQGTITMPKRRSQKQPPLPRWNDDFSFFEFAEAAHLTLTPPSTLRRWIALGVVEPSRSATDDDGNKVSGFSLRDLAYIRVIRHLTLNDEMPLERAVEHVAHALARLSPLGSHWADAHLLASDGSPLMWIRDQDGVTRSIPGAAGRGQYVFEEMLDLQVRQMLLGPESLLIPEDLLAHIEMNPRKRDGHPVIRGTNITTKMVFGVLAQPDGFTVAHRLHPFVPAEAFLAVQKFHSEYLHERPKVPVG